MSMNSMMQFRTSYLKAIAKAWADPALFRRMATSDDGFAFLEGPKPNWDVELHFRENRMPGNGYRPELTGSWVGPNAILELRLPKAPDDAEEHAAALAEYYALLPSPFGFERSEEVQDGAESGGSSHQVTSAGAGGSGMGHFSDALVLGGVVMRALALSWESADFREHVFSRGRALGALQAWLGYSCPWNMDIEAVPSSIEWLPGLGFSAKPRNRLTMWLPNRPEGHGLGVALAAYNQTGDAYPLTCP
ncbi:MAG: BMA_0021/BMA_0022 family TOMM bacteriocin [Myxococcales bacterium]|nr:BMA_0021/BMA_0022 family TOMM bacteriocin [Myxococcales bacterium]MDD9969063.1 BMA_0021/BMA_0022 family TOMM bacteriocin [Myxococcales bacterium]